MNRFPKCCNPFPRTKCSKKLQKVSDFIKDCLPQSIESKDDLYICSSCYINLACNRKKIQIETSPVPGPSASPVPGPSALPFTPETVASDDISISSNSEERHLKDITVLEQINKIMPVINKSPIYLSQLETRGKHQHQKIRAFTSFLQSSSTSLVTGIEPLEQPMTDQRKAALYDEFMNQMKSKFKELKTDHDKIQLLTCVPKSLTLQEIQNEFNATQHMVRTAKKLQNEKGPLSIPETKAGKRISDELKQSVLDYYNDDDVSRIMPGKNDCLTIGKEKVQKRLMLCSLKECYEGYKMLHQDDESKQIGFSKFSLLRPKNCVQPGTSGTHSVCVCTIHQNVKLIIYGAKIETITNREISHYTDCIKSILCANPTKTCYLIECNNCPGLDRFRDYLKKSYLDYDDIYSYAEIRFNQWVSIDRCILENYSKSLEDFLDYFLINLKQLIPHYYISHQQSSFIKQKKLELKDTEVLVSCDFAENYKFVMQNAAQGFHWNNKQATIHPFVIYKKVEGVLCHYSYIIISDCLHHDTVAVYLFIEKLIQFLKAKFSTLSKIYYVTDGAVSHYKNKKKFFNVMKHRDDFGIDCEWHFHATAHGKGPCDGVGGTIKRMAYRASLTNEFEGGITNAQELFKWAKSLNTDMEFEFCSDKDYKIKQKVLARRFEQLKTFKGTHGFHAVIPTEDGFLKCKKYSNSEEFVIFNH